MTIAVAASNKRRSINWLKDVMPAIKKRLEVCASLQIVPTLRGIFYTLVSLNILENTPNRYDYLSLFTARAREKSEKVIDKDGKPFSNEEILPIDCFADNVRQIIDIEDEYETLEDYIDRGIYHVREAEVNYKIPRWLNQPHYVEVWSEKDAMTGTVNSIINTGGIREVRIVPTRGQESVTFAWQHVQRLKKKQDEGKIIHIRYFGDLDPSGKAIEEATKNKLMLEPYNLKDIDFKRVGVTLQQKREFNLIANTDKQTMAKLKRDPTRFAFMSKYDIYNEEDLFQIEVDALEAIEPEAFRSMVLAAVDEFFDEEIYRQTMREMMPTRKEIREEVISQTDDLRTSLQTQRGSDDEE